jgi:hypothetical protein
MSKKCGNYEARSRVQSRTPFTANNLYGVRAGTSNEPMYIVYSYGEHWPLFIYHEPTDTWFENSDKYSVTTSKHRSQSHPLCETVSRPKPFMRNLVSVGLVKATSLAADVRVAA